MLVGGGQRARRMTNQEAKPPRSLTKRLAVVLGVAATLYVASYLVLVSHGMAVGTELGLEGYMFFDLREPGGEDLHFACLRLYAPLIRLEHWLGTDRAPVDCVLVSLE